MLPFQHQHDAVRGLALAQHCGVGIQAKSGLNVDCKKKIAELIGCTT